MSCYLFKSLIWVSFNNGLLVGGRIIIEFIAEALDLGYLWISANMDLGHHTMENLNIHTIEVSQEYGYEAEAHPVILVYRSI